MDGDIKHESVRVGGRRIGDLYAKATQPHPPRWLSYLSGHVDVRALRLRVSSASAVLLINSGGRLYAITFGHGHTLLSDKVIESSFGLKVTLNAIDETGVRAIDHKRLDSVTRLTREQLERESDVTDFGLDVERDLLRAVVGRPRDRSLGTRLAGADRLIVFGGPQLVELPTYLVRLGDLAARVEYRAAFPWVDNLREVRDSVLVEGLWNETIDLIKQGRHDLVHLTIPEIVDWEIVDHFRYSTNRAAPRHNDLDLADYLNERAPRLEELLDRIADDRVYGWSVDATEPSRTWSVKRCLTAEINRDNVVYILSDGKWYQASHHLVDEIAEAIRATPTTNVQLPQYEGGSEDAFNDKASVTSGGVLHLIHPQKVRVSNRGSVEPCDLYSSGRVFLHVKRYHGASAMSHLFSQGWVSAELFARDRSFRAAFNGLLPAAHRIPDPERTPQTAEYEVAYVVLGRTGGPPGLPFFGRANLRMALRQLALMGYAVTLSTLPNVQAVPPPIPRSRPARRRRSAVRAVKAKE
jgi:uncharacterized protein (TIGR04141 family)